LPCRHLHTPVLSTSTFLFLSNHTPSTPLSTLSLHDALPISVRRDDDFNLDLARNVHALGEFRIRRCRPGLDLAFGFVRRTRLSKPRGARKQKGRSCRESPLPPPTSSHRHNSL